MPLAELDKCELCIQKSPSSDLVAQFDSQLLKFFKFYFSCNHMGSYLSFWEIWSSEHPFLQNSNMSEALESRPHSHRAS